MYKRLLEKKLIESAGQYPVVTITGPRQSGKSTLIKGTFPTKPYANLESTRTKNFAQSDPVGFLGQFPNGAAIDEIQKVPELTSDIQVMVDERKSTGQFILSGSENLVLSESVSQSLAGRTAILKLLPLTIGECRNFPLECEGLDQFLYTGFYPRIHADCLNPTDFYGSYVETYIERDIRNLLQVKDLSKFRLFVELCAGRIGQLLNKNSLASDVGVAASTIEHWFSILEATFICFRLQPWHHNTTKRLVKSPKLYFYDVGLASYLIGIDEVSQIRTHPLRGALFENLQVVELQKHLYNLNRHNRFYFYRDSQGNEVDLVIQKANTLLPIEIKSSQTFHNSFLKGINHLKKLKLELLKPAVVMGGTSSEHRSDFTIVPWTGLYNFLTSSLR